MAVITISRPYGIGGRSFGLDLARALGYEYFDKEILAMLSSRLEHEEGRLALYEEAGYCPSEALQAMIVRKYPSAGADFPTSASYAAAVTSILKELAGRDGAVIVGRGGQAVLSDHPSALHLRLVASEDYLVTRLRQERSPPGSGVKEIRRRISRQNETRRKFVLKHFGIDWADPLHYHLVMNMERLGTGRALTAVLALVGGGREKEKPLSPA